jgi:hypothetical protein
LYFVTTERKVILYCGALKSDQKLRADKTAHEDLAILELQKAVVGDNINFVKIPTINQERAAFANKTALTLFGFWGDSHQFIFGYADKYPYIGELYYSFDSLVRKIRPAKNCPEGEGIMCSIGRKIAVCFVFIKSNKSKIF